MKFLDKSLIEWPIRALWTVFPFFYTYQGGVPGAQAAYEHFYTGYVASLVFCHLSEISLWFLLGIPFTWLLHFVLKELWFDRHKHWAKPGAGEPEWTNLKADTLTRNAGFIFALPSLIFVLLRHYLA